MLKRLAGEFASREEELDELLRDGVFVDLYRVVVEGMRIGMPGYGLKKVEGFYMEQRETTVTDGDDSMVEFERWLEQGGLDGGDQEILEAIAEYNRDDCVSTLQAARLAARAPRRGRAEASGRSNGSCDEDRARRGRRGASTPRPRR